MRRPFSLLAVGGVVGQFGAMTDPTPWFAAEADSAPDGRRHAPATLRNRDALLAVLRAELPASGAVLEIASGTGEHAVFFAAALPNNIWQPSDAEPSALESIRAWVEACDPPLRNVLPPVMLDVGAPIWPVAAADAVFTANLTHIAPWSATKGLFAGAADVLQTGAPLILYGPFFRKGHEPGQGDAAFDAKLRARDPALGLRFVEDVADVAAAHGFALTRQHAMPADNLTLIFHRN